MVNLRKGASFGPRCAVIAVDGLTQGSIADCRSAVASATRAQLIAAHRWCEGNLEGNKVRKEIIADELRRRHTAAQLETSGRAAR